MSAYDGGWTGRGRHHHLWPHGTRVLDLGDDVHVAAHLRDFAAHDYDLRGVRVLGVGAVHVVAYYDGRLQSGLTQRQRDLVRAWVRRHAAATDGSAVAAPVRAPVWSPDLDARAVANVARLAGRRAARERTRWLLVGVLPAALALVFVASAVAVDGTGARGGPILVSAASVLALTSALITWRHTRG